MSLLVEPLVHIASGGEMTGPILRRIFRSHVVVSLKDTLSFGPIRRGLSPDAWGHMRASFWLESPSDDQPERVQDWATLFRVVRAASGQTGFVIWLGQTVAEYLSMIWSVVVLRELGISDRRIFYVLVASDASTGDIPSLVGMDEKGLRTQWGRARAVSEAESDLIVRAWNAWSSADPHHLWQFAETRESAIPNLVDRVGRLRLHYPALPSGLDRISRNLLEICAAAGPDTPRVIAKLLDARYQGDPDEVPPQLALRRLMRFGDRRLAHPLLHLEGDPQEPYTTRLRLTEMAERVLAGDANHVDLNGIDEWIGGVHLAAPPGPVWYVRGTLLHQK